VHNNPIILLIGRSKSGKDEFFKILKDAGVNVHRVSMADKLKQLTADLLNISLEELEKNKEKYRDFLIYGGNLVRKISSTYWVEEAAKSIPIKDKNKLYVVTDVRYYNELSYFRWEFNDDFVAVPIYSTLEVLKSRGYNEKNFNHISESLVEIFLKPPYNQQSKYIYKLLENNGSYEDFKAKVLECYSHINQTFNGVQN
jgi:hypothetical protein